MFAKTIQKNCLFNQKNKDFFNNNKKFKQIIKVTNLFDQSIVVFSIIPMSTQSFKHLKNAYD